MTENETLEPDGTSDTRRAITLLLGGAAIIFCVGVLFGFGQTILEGEAPSASALLVLAGLTSAIVLLSVFIWKQLKKRPGNMMAASERNSRIIYIASMVIGGFVGIYMVATDGAGFSTMFSNGPISSLTAMGGIIGFGLLMPIITILWWRATDEHELKAYSDGALIAFHAYIFVVPSWWLAARAGWLPQPDPMIIFCGVMLIWSAVWFARKYR